MPRGVLPNHLKEKNYFLKSKPINKQENQIYIATQIYCVAQICVLKIESQNH